MIESILIAIVVAVVVGLVLLFVGTVLAKVGANVPLLVVVGGYLVDWCWLIGLIAGLLYFVTGGHWKL